MYYILDGTSCKHDMSFSLGANLRHACLVTWRKWSILEAFYSGIQYWLTFTPFYTKDIARVPWRSNRGVFLMLLGVGWLVQQGFAGVNVGWCWMMLDDVGCLGNFFESVWIPESQFLFSGLLEPFARCWVATSGHLAEFLAPRGWMERCFTLSRLDV